MNNEMHTVIFLGADVTVCARNGENLLDVIRANEIDIPADCGGRGSCGKCTVTIGGERCLACQTVVDSDMDVTIPHGGSDSYDILTDSGSCGVDSTTTINPERTIAIDIGTTTVVVKLADSADRDICIAAEMNEQRSYGADVISRIDASMDDPSLLSGIITNQLDNMISRVIEDSGTDASDVKRIVVSGNTTMCYLLLGLPCRSLGLAPFEPAFSFKETYAYHEVFHANTLESPVYILPFVSSFIGGDITAGLMTLDGACSVGEDTATDKKENATDDIYRHDSFILVDMGTNGEIAYSAQGRIRCTSTAAGPAFEGGNISCGSGSIEGAISKIAIKDNSFAFETIGGAPARSICGSGILDAMACFADEGIIKATGALNSDSPFVADNSVVVAAAADGAARASVITHKDIREFQLAKSAIRAGIETLIDEFDGHIPDRLYLAGGFGQHLNPESAFRIGLIPETLRGKVIPIGNSSLAGAALAAANTDHIEAASQIAKKGEEINLASHPLFNKLFMEYMKFR
jgi:uncharacterized 2Fe-2S/4Fe-4S cluster protein (DUF4445 family)